MAQPLKQYCLSLCGKLGKTPREIYEGMTIDDVMDSIAYDMTQNPEWRDKFTQEQEQAKYDALTLEQRREREAIEVRNLLMGFKSA